LNERLAAERRIAAFAALAERLDAWRSSSMPWLSSARGRGGDGSWDRTEKGVG
jgi:hypothetical protein